VYIDNVFVMLDRLRIGRHRRQLELEATLAGRP
jgi:hypothetical protein